MSRIVTFASRIGGGESTAYSGPGQGGTAVIWFEKKETCSKMPPRVQRNFRLCKKTSLNLRRTFCFICLAENMLEGWDIIHLKGEIHSSIWSTKNFLYDKREPRYKQIKIRYQIKKILDSGQSSVLKFDVPYCFTYISAFLCFTKMGLTLKHA